MSLASGAASGRVTKNHPGTFARSPKGVRADTEEPEDLPVHDLFLWAKGRHFDLASSNADEFGWVNDPE